ncbi:MAG: carbohydrate-binding domain-containing protein, partial [Bacteroidota bacterium]|nr:carbohydrate-binding domain-containing protein [Bacteroidota bacterium]
MRTLLLPFVAVSTSLVNALTVFKSITKDKSEQIIPSTARTTGTANINVAYNDAQDSVASFSFIKTPHFHFNTHFMKASLRKPRLFAITLTIISSFLLSANWNVINGQKADVTISTSTSNGSWTFAGGTHTFRPNANVNNATVNATEIVQKLQGTAGNTEGNVTILTSNTGGGGTGDIIISSPISASNNYTSTFTLTLTADRNITVSSAIAITGSNGAGSSKIGKPGVNLVLTAGSSGSVLIKTAGATINTSGGSASGAGEIGGNGGNVTITGPAGVSINQDITANGGNGNIAMGGRGGDITINDGSATVTTAGANDGQTGGVIASTGGTGSPAGVGGDFIKTGIGTFNIAGTNTYTGNTTITAGTLRVSASVQASANGALGNSPNAVRLNGGNIEFNNLTFSRAISLTANGSRIDAYGSARTVSANISATGTFTLEVGGTTASGAAGQNLTLSGTISNGTGTLSLKKINNSTVIFSGVNSYTGLTTISSGTLTLGGAINGNNTIVGDITINGGTLNYNANSEQISNSSNITLSSGTYDLSARDEIIGSLAMTGGSLARGTGNLTLSNPSSITGGTLTFSSVSSRISTNNTLTLGGATFNYNSTSSGDRNLFLGGDVSYSGTAPAVFANTNTGIGEFRLGSGVTRNLNISSASL